MSPARRALWGAAGAAAYLGAGAALGGWRPDPVLLAAAGLAAWLAPRRWRPLALFAAPLLMVAAAYDAQRYWVGLRGAVHVAQPRAWELAWFGIGSGASRVTPAGFLQAHAAPWIDVLAGAAYLSYLAAFLGAAAWWRFGRRLAAAQDLMWQLLWINLAGYATYMAYPAAPPWYADRYGLGPAVLSAAPEAAGGARFDALLGVHAFRDFYAKNTNIFGAIPSLHVGQTFLLVIFAWRARSLRSAASAYFACVVFASVYLNHHYLVDGVVGSAYAAGVVLAMEAWRRRVPAGGAG